MVRLTSLVCGSVAYARTTTTSSYLQREARVEPNFLAANSVVGDSLAAYVSDPQADTFNYDSLDEDDHDLEANVESNGSVTTSQKTSKRPQRFRTRAPSHEDLKKVPPHILGHKEEHLKLRDDAGSSLAEKTVVQHSQEAQPEDGASSTAQNTRTVAAVSDNFKTQKEIIDETRAVMLQRAVEMERNAVLQSECAHFAGHIGFLKYVNYDALQRKCTLKCEGDKAMWKKEHTCAVRQLRTIVADGGESFAQGGNTLWMWHFGSWDHIGEQCVLASDSAADDSDEWFENEGCDSSCETKDEQLCNGCFTGCTQPRLTEIALRYQAASRNHFQPDNRITFECKPNNCWSAGVAKIQLTGQCFCERGTCNWGVCVNGDCEQAPKNDQSLIDQGCEDCTGGRCIRPVNAHQCAENTQTGPNELCMLSDSQPALFGANQLVRFQCGRYHGQGYTAHAGVIGDQLTEVAMNRCWRDGRKESVMAKCMCYGGGAGDCSFKEYVNNTEVSPNVFTTGCLMDHCHASPVGGYGF